MSIISVDNKFDHEIFPFQSSGENFHDVQDEVDWRVTGLHRSVVTAIRFIQFYKAVSRSVTPTLHFSSTELHGYRT